MRKLVWAAVVGLFMTGCQEREARWAFDRSSQASLVVVFKRGTSTQAETRLVEEQLSVKTSPTQYWHREGVGAIVSVEADGHHAFAVTLDPDVTPEQRRLIMRDLETSPSVLAVFENIAPAQVRIPADRGSQVEK